MQQKQGEGARCKKWCTREGGLEPPTLRIIRVGWFPNPNGLDAEPAEIGIESAATAPLALFYVRSGINVEYTIYNKCI